MKTIGHLNTRRFGMLLIAVLLAAGVGSITGRTPVAHANSIVVNSTADTIDSGDGTCTLREAIIQANADAGPIGPAGECSGASGTDTISFDASVFNPGTTITLLSALPTITTDMDITGLGATLVTVDGANSYRPFRIESGATVTLSGMTVTHGNSGAAGGGILNQGTLTVANSTISSNTTSGAGGGIANLGGTLTVANSTFSGNNSSSSDGGGIFSNATLVVSNSSFSGNMAVAGGGIASNGILVTVTNSTLSLNTASNVGGGLHIGSGMMVITNSTLSGNTGNYGGGINMNGGTVTFYNSIVANNTGVVAINDCRNFSGTLTADTYNIDSDGSCDNATTKTTGEINLLALADNGGPTQTMALGTGSAALDAGDDAVCAAAVGSPTFGAGGLDQRGVTRPQGAHCDVGAYEAEVATLTIRKVTSPAGGTGFPFTIDPGPYSYSLQWGNLGFPQGIGIDAAGNVYVTNSTTASGNFPVNKYGPSGGLLSQWGGFGTAESQFSNPFGLTSDAAGNVYVVDEANSRIQKFNSSGAFLRMWGWGVDDGSNAFQTCTSGCQAGIGGSGDGQFNNPTDVAVDAAGNVYVVDKNNSRIQKFNSSGAFLLKWGTNGSGDGQFIDPLSVAVDAAGDVYVAEAGNNRVQKFDGAGAFLLKWGSSGTAEGQFSLPQAVTVDAAGNVYVADGSNNRVQKFDSSGAFLSMWGWGVDDGTAAFQNCTSGCQAGIAGSGNGQFNFALDVAVNASGTVYVLDTAAGRRIQAFTPALTTVLNDGESHTFTLLPGTYLVSELVPDGWQVSSIQCRDPARGPATARITLVAGDNRNCTFTNTQIPTAITLASFNATAQAGLVHVTWETFSEFNNAGFNLYRGLLDDGSDRALLASVPSQSPGSTQGAAYSYIDSAVEPGQTYWYWLEDIDLSGATTLHGPVSATVQAPTAVTLAQLDASSGLASPAGWLLALLAGLLAMSAAGAQRLDGLRARVVKLGRLADDKEGVGSKNAKGVGPCGRRFASYRSGSGRSPDRACSTVHDVPPG